jgi:3-isopropylmalate/(R)-2-methylmalate dehydratase small subunit
MAEKFTRFTAVAAPYEPVNVDTDQIIPARFLKYPRSHGYGQFLFHDVREEPGFILKQPPFDQAKILVANANFGCGSSREGAPYAFHDAGFRSIIAPSFGDIFFNNCLKNGIVPVRLDSKTCLSIRNALKEKPGSEITVDLQTQRVATPSGEFGFAIDPFFREMLLEGVDELGLTLSMLPQIEAFEKSYAAATPWLPDATRPGSPRR